MARKIVVLRQAQDKQVVSSKLEEADFVLYYLLSPNSKILFTFIYFFDLWCYKVDSCKATEPCGVALGGSDG
jgi:hypothetical protein